MMKLNTQNNEIIYIFIVVISIVLYGLFINRNAYNEYKNNGCFTLGIIDEVKAMKGGKICKYKYIVNSIEFNMTNYISPYEPKLGEFYYVIYLKNNPQESRIILGYKIVDDGNTKINIGATVEKRPLVLSEEMIEDAIN